MKGVIVHGFELLKKQEIPEVDTRASLYRHLKTGAELLSLENRDENKVFGITFRTPPPDSTGLPHILEHSVLNGSKKYPVKEPFVELVKGSLNTFINAFTYPDKTCYPVASQNLQDFYNLIDVYLDAVFHPLIPPETLQQEGWHYELGTDGDREFQVEDASLSYKGVVFNEMKGAYSSPDSLLSRYTQQSLFPDHVYGYDSGGDPHVIPNLTYEQFKAFHETYYHPSNARIFFYGDDAPGERLRLMDGYLGDFEAIDIDSTISLQPGFDHPRRIVRPYDAGQEAGGSKGMVTINWLLSKTDDTTTTLALHILSHILVGTPASPLRKVLIDSGLGEDLTGGGLESELIQMYFSTGLKGIAVEDADKVEALVVQTLETLAREGIDPDMVGAALNTIEFRLRENNTGAFPRGLSLMLQSLTTWLYGGDPIAPLAFETPLTAIKEREAGGERYFESMIQEFFLENTHRTTVVLEPDPDLRRREDAAENERLAKIQSSMVEDELRSVAEDARKLKLRQSTPDPPEALATIPSLELSDLDKENKLIPIVIMDIAGSKVLYHDLFTNGILYLDIGLNLHALPQELLPYVTLFGRALLEMGTDSEDFVKLSQRIGRSTGGIRPVSFISAVREKAQSTAWLYLRGKATVEKADQLLAILRDVLVEARFNQRDRFRQILLEGKAAREAQLVPMGHRVVNTRLRALFDEAGWADEQIGGVKYLFTLRRLVDSVENDWPAVLDNLERIWEILINRGTMLCNLTLDGENWGRFEPQLSDFLESLPSNPVQITPWTMEPATAFEGLAIPSQVNYVGKGANLYQLGYDYHGSVSVIINHLRTTWLWEQVRVQGGAYGGFCLFNHRSGVFTYLSYRDPNLLGTLDNYDRTGQFLRRLDLSRTELTKSIIGAIGELDAYQLPDAKGYSSMLRCLAGDSDESRQVMRDQILGTTLADFHAFGEVLQRIVYDGPVVVMGSQEAIEAANAAKASVTAQQDWLTVNKVL